LLPLRGKYDASQQVSAENREPAGAPGAQRKTNDIPTYYKYAPMVEDRIPNGGIADGLSGRALIPQINGGKKSVRCG
jgi:hypothetical protein